ncbi:MAG: hypothetical protein Q7U75_18730, partial [Desulfobacterales bacterium]|nr:hypothetical protein [Desulfobacterales bacterium]
GPRVVNNVVVHRTTIVKVEEIHVYRNAHVRNAVVAVHEDHFQRGGFTKERLTRVDAKDLRPIHTAPRVRETPASFGSTPKPGHRPPEKDLGRPVVSTRPSHASTQPAEHRERKPDAAETAGSGPHIVERPQPRENAAELPRPPFGHSTVERRPETGRAQQPAPPKNEGLRRPDRYPESKPPVVQRPPQQPQQPQRPDRSERAESQGRPEQQVNRPTPASASAPNRIEGSRAPARQLPGEPASRLAPNRAETGSPQRLERGERPTQRSDQREPATDVRRPKATPDNTPRMQRQGEKAPSVPRSPGGA